jgi:hypothetical protein
MKPLRPPVALPEPLESLETTLAAPLLSRKFAKDSLPRMDLPKLLAAMAATFRTLLGEGEGVVIQKDSPSVTIKGGVVSFGTSGLPIIGPEGPAPNNGLMVVVVPSASLVVAGAAEADAAKSEGGRGGRGGRGEG